MRICADKAPLCERGEQGMLNGPGHLTDPFSQNDCPRGSEVSFIVFPRCMGKLLFCAERGSASGTTLPKRALAASAVLLLSDSMGLLANKSGSVIRCNYT